MSTLNNRIEQFFTETENLTTTGNMADASRLLQDFISKNDLIKARAFNDSGVISFRQGNNEKSLEYYQKAVALAPKESVYRKNLADLCYFVYGDTETALVHYRQILADNPSDFDASLAIGRICADLSRHFLSEAEDFFNIAEKIKPNDEFLAAERERISRDSVETLKTKTAYQSTFEPATNTNSNNPEELYSKLYSSFQPNQELETEKALLVFIDNHPGFALAHNDLGVISHQLKKFDQAGQAYRKAVEIAPENITFRKNLADFLFIIEQKPEDAMPHYHEILKNNPKDLETLMMIGNICLALGSSDEARNFYNLVLDIEPWNLDASETLKMLDKREKEESENSPNK